MISGWLGRLRWHSRDNRGYTWDVAVGVVVCLAVAALYLATLQADVTGSDERYMDDVGEFQVALNIWGTLHPPGYPLYSLLGGLFVHGVRGLGLNPAASASLFSLFCAVSALGIIYVILVTLAIQRWLAALLTLLLATTRMVWLNSVIAEVYSLNLLLVAMAFLLMIVVRRDRREGMFPLLGLVLGLGVGHHRTVGLLLPALAIYLWPVLRRLKWRTVCLSLAAFILPFLVYLYLPFRGRPGMVWVYGHPYTWRGFWEIFWVKEFHYVLAPPQAPTSLLSALVNIVRLHAAQLTALGTMLGSLGLLLTSAVRKGRSLGGTLILGYSSFMLFATCYRPDIPQTMLIPATFIIVIGLGLLVAQFANWTPRGALLLPLLLAGLILWLGRENYPYIRRLTSNDRGRRLIEAVKALENSRPVVVSLWGPQYFALSYGRLVTGELASMELVTPDSDLRGFLEEDNHLYTPKDIFYLVPLAEWDEMLGRAHLTSASIGVVEIADRPPLTLGDVPGGEEVSLGGLITLLGYDVNLDQKEGSLRLTLYWRADEEIAEDYSVFIHITEKSQMASQEDILVQADSLHPVYGFYPTTRWQPGEVVRDDYLIPLPVGSEPLMAKVGMYTQDSETGAFHNLGEVDIKLR